MIFLNNDPVNTDVFIDGNEWLKFEDAFKNRREHYSCHMPFIKWNREENDYRDFACMYYLLRYLYRLGVDKVGLNIFVRDGLNPVRIPCLGFGTKYAIGVDWTVSKWHIEDDPEYVDDYTVDYYELEAKHG